MLLPSRRVMLPVTLWLPWTEIFVGFGLRSTESLSCSEAGWKYPHLRQGNYFVMWNRRVRGRYLKWPVRKTRVKFHPGNLNATPVWHVQQGRQLESKAIFCTSVPPSVFKTIGDGSVFALRTEWLDLPEQGQTLAQTQFKSAALQIRPMGLGTHNSQESIVTWVKFQLSLAYYFIYFLNHEALSISGLESSLLRPNSKLVGHEDCRLQLYCTQSVPELLPLPRLACWPVGYNVKEKLPQPSWNSLSQALSSTFWGVPLTTFRHPNG